jgi:hypothetical protein
MKNFSGPLGCGQHTEQEYKAMTNDDTWLPVSPDGEQPQDAVPGPPQDDEAELDTAGMPVEDRLARGIAKELQIINTPS